MLNTLSYKHIKLETKNDTVPSLILTVALLLLPVALKGSMLPKGSVDVCLKKQSAAKGSEPLKGSPPKGSLEKTKPRQNY